MSVSTNDLKRGMTLDLDGTLFQIIEFQHVKPGKGGAFVRTKLRNVRSGAVIDRTFNAGVNVGLAIVERKDMQFLYRDGDDFVFMDTDTYDQHHVPSAVVGDVEDRAVSCVRQHRGAQDERAVSAVGRSIGRARARSRNSAGRAQRRPRLRTHGG